MEQKTRKKRKLGSYPFISVIFSITLALSVIGLFGLLFVHANKLTTLIQENIEVQVFLDKELPSSEFTRISRSISSKDYVLIKEENPGVRLITKEVAAEQFTRDTGEDFTEFLGDNPLRDLYVVNIRQGYHHSDSLAMIKRDIESMRGVYEVAYVESLVESINDNLTKIGIILSGFFSILLVIVVVLINNTIKLALFSQRFLIRSMQLVGATSSFIRNPFLRRAAWYGFIAGVLACTALTGIMYYAYQNLDELAQLQDLKKLGFLFLYIIVMGMVVGFVSTYRAVRKYLKMSLDELY